MSETELRNADIDAALAEAKEAYVARNPKSFARFVEATRYQTVAERPPDPREFPDVPPEDLKPGSIVFKPPRRARSTQRCQ